VIDSRTAGVVDVFRRRHGRDPAGVFAAPGRVNLIGEHTDYNDGLVLPIAIGHSAVVAVGIRTDGEVTGWSAQLGDGGSAAVDTAGPPTAAGWLSYVVGVAWAMRDLVGAPGLDLVVDSDVPVGAGLSSSAALECAVALAIAELAGVDIDRMALALAAQRAEHEVVGAPVGVMDHAVSLLARPHAALFLDCRTLSARLVPFRPSGAGLAMLVIDTRVHHAHAGGEYAARRRECEEAAAGLGLPSLRDASEQDIARLPSRLGRRARHVVTENARVEAAVGALAADDFVALGLLFAESHRSLRSDFEVSVPELDTVVTAAVDAGALGARMTGGGFGGSAIALVRQGDRATVATAVVEAFGSAGFGRPEIFEVEASGGARRVEVA
jgi:galactokinase